MKKEDLREKFITVYLEGLNEKENRFIKAQLQKILSEGAPLLKLDLEVEVPLTYLIIACKTGGIVKFIRIRDAKGRLIKTLKENEVKQYDENDDGSLKNFNAIISKGEVWVELTTVGWQETFREIIFGLQGDEGEGNNNNEES